MSLELTIMLVALIGLNVGGFPIGFSLLVSGMLYLMVSGGDPSIAAEALLHGVYAKFVLIAVPLFIFAANVMNDGKISERILRFALALVGRLPGGLAQVNVASSLLFSGMSGSATADVAGVGNVLMKMMRDGGKYPRGFAAALTAASASIGPVFPPSLGLIFYSLVSATSVGGLFLAGVLPGLLMATALMIAVHFIARKRAFPTEHATPLIALPAIALAASLPLVTPFIILWGIYTGIFTATEAAAVAALYALILSVLVYRVVGLRKLYEILLKSSRTSAIVGTLIMGAFIFGFIASLEQIPQSIASFVDAMDLEPLGFLLVVNVVLLFLGCIMASSTIILVIVPMLVPSALALGIDPLHFGIVVVLNAVIGLVTPPYGVLLFTISSLSDVPVGEVIRESWLLIGVLLLALFIVVLFPQISLLLPQLAGY